MNLLGLKERIIQQLKEAEEFLRGLELKEEKEAKEKSRMPQAKLEKIYSDPDDRRSIHYTAVAEGVWDGFIQGISSSIKNRSLNKYPVAKVNSDQSISFFLHKCDTVNCKECKEADAFEKKFNESYIIDQLDYYRKKFSFQLTGNTGQLLEKKGYSAVTNVTEYQLNISPENLDSILKLSPKYSYRGEDSILKLTKKFALKPGVIRLFPVAPIDEKSNVMRAVGCQMVEMPAVQLLHLLPGFDGKEKYFHWVPTEVAENLYLAHLHIVGIINDLLLEEGMLPDGKKFSVKDSEKVNVIYTPANSHGTVGIVAIDSNTRDFYLLYGNIGAEELQHCKSVEVNTLAFLKKIKNFLENQSVEINKSASYPLDELKKRQKEIQNGLSIIGQMIENAKKELVVPPQHVYPEVAAASGSPLHAGVAAQDQKAKPIEVAKAIAATPASRPK